MEVDLVGLIGQPEGVKLEYKAVLPPARTLGQILAAFANAQGGVIVLGVREINGRVVTSGLSEDFHANTILNKALDLLSPVPITENKYITHEGKRLFIISVQHSITPVLIEGKIYIRRNDENVLTNPSANNFTSATHSGITTLANNLNEHQRGCTGAMSKFIDHYKSILNIVADLGSIMYPVSSSVKTENNDGKILIRILFSSCADNFETYLSDLLYEIFLANPDTLKSGQQVTVKEVLDCSDIQEFINYYAKKKLGKLQRGSVKGFISENQQISTLNAITQVQQEELERILQIRHLYAHKNGIVDEKFFGYFPEEFEINESHEMTLDSFIAYIQYIESTVLRIDQAAILLHNLASV